MPRTYRVTKVPKSSPKKSQALILILGLVSILFYFLAQYIPLKQGERLKAEMIRASEIMAEASSFIRECRKEKGLAIDIEKDLNQTGLIGVEFSSITTSIGSLEAKRTTTNPNFAALIVFLLNRAGVKRGETIAVGASGSFPALIVAVLSASKAMALKPLIICSLGASQWGANLPDFHWLRMQSCLQEAGIFEYLPVALSLGGDEDTGLDMSPEGRSYLLDEVEEWGGLVIHEPDLRRNVQQRMSVYEAKSGEHEIKAFINIGGSWSSMGTDFGVLELKPGLARFKSFPPAETRGLMHEMALRKIQLIHLLYVQGLAQRYRLPWDPKPLPEPGEGKIYKLAIETQPSFFLIAAVYFLVIILILLFRNWLSLLFKKEKILLL